MDGDQLLYYKLVQENKVVGVVTSHHMVYYQPKHNVLIGCDISKAQYVLYKDCLYRALWMVPDHGYKDCTVLDICEIDFLEYDALRCALEVEHEVVLEQTSESDPTESVIEEPVITYVRNMKILEMSRDCNQSIENGFDLMISDGALRHFSLTTQDQINLLSLSSLITSGITEIPYHADGELCIYYCAEDIAKIIEAATQFKTYHISYFNSLKNWISAMDDLSDIHSVQYGIDIPDEYCSAVFLEMKKRGLSENNA